MPTINFRTRRSLVHLAIIFIWHAVWIYTFWVLSTGLVFRCPLLTPFLDMLDLIDGNGDLSP